MEEFEDFLGELTAELPQPQQIKLSRKTSKKLRVMGVRGLCITDYDETYGPYLRLYLSKRSYLYRRIIENPAFLADLLVLAKDTREMLMRDERSLVIFRPLDKACMRLILLETTKEFRSNVEDFLDELCEKLGGGDLTPERVSATIEEILLDYAGR